MTKNILLAAALMTMSISAGAQVGVSIQLGEPGFYGQIDIGGAPPPQLIYPQPVVIAPAPQFRGVAPIYLRVPPGYAEHWGQYCARYSACGRPVYFVRDDWYLNRYAPYYRDRHGHPHPYEHERREHYEHYDHGHDHHGYGR